MKKRKKILAVLLVVSMLSVSLGGCGRETLTDNASKTSIENQESGSEKESSPENTAMGRYVEKTFDMSGSIGYANGIYVLEDGSLILADTANNMFMVTKDGGESWATETRDWAEQIQKNNAVRSLAIGKDNTVGIIYDTLVQDRNDEDYNPFEENLEVMIVEADGTQIPVQMNLAEGETPDRIWIADSGRIFVSTFSSYGSVPNIYEIKKDGSSELFLELEMTATLIQFQNQLMIIDGYEYDGLLLYDMEKGEYIEDDVLNDFIRQNYADRSNNTGGSFYNMFFFTGEENVLYLAGKKGLHRHVIGGSAIEQVIDGSLSIFNNPSYALRGMVMLNSSEFMAIFTNGELVRFTYNPDIPTVPSGKLKVYSLEDNKTLRQAITLYQTANPDVFVEYEIGMEGESSITREDALKNLNTKIAAGESPDVFILDNLPIDSYIEKGLLQDIDALVEDMDGENALFENIVETFRTEDKIYEIPCEIQLPVVFGKEDYVSKMTDLEKIADAMERMREDYPGEDLCGFCSKESIMRLFGMIAVPYWKTDKGEVDKDALSVYLTQVKRIYDAQMESLSEEKIDRYYDLSEMYREIYGFSLDNESDWIREGVNYIDYVTGLRKLAFGTLNGDFEYAVLASMEKMAEYEDCEAVLISPDIFCAKTLAGVSAVSENEEQAKDFLILLLGKENQSSLFGGLPVNRAAFEAVTSERQEADTNDIYSDMGMMDEDGNIVRLLVYYPSKEDVQKLQNWIESVRIPYIEDDLLEEAVYEEGAAYLDGSRSLENALESIEKKVALYIAE
ncbi:MAG: ABC transporter substrate-binding protein [Clostridium sp.]|nr:ABC transporter substrate-binding protein [Clostridium sp.]